MLSQSVVVLRSILSSSALNASATGASRPVLIETLVRLLDSGRIVAPAARANVYWLLGQFCREGDLLADVVADTVRLGVKGFAEEVRLRFLVYHERPVPAWC